MLRRGAQSRETCCVLKEGDDDGPTEFEGADVFDILPAATVECAICRELRRTDEMNRHVRGSHVGELISAALRNDEG